MKISIKKTDKIIDVNNHIACVWRGATDKGTDVTALVSYNSSKRGEYFVGEPTNQHVERGAARVWIGTLDFSDFKTLNILAIGVPIGEGEEVNAELKPIEVKINPFTITPIA